MPVEVPLHAHVDNGGRKGGVFVVSTALRSSALCGERCGVR